MWKHSGGCSENDADAANDNNMSVYVPPDKDVEAAKVSCLFSTKTDHI